jgi:hypothetical protein
VAVKKPSKSRQQLAVENDFLRSYHGASNTTRVILELVKWLGFVAIAFFCWLSIDSLSGKMTSANINIHAEAQGKFGPNSAAPEQSEATVCPPNKTGLLAQGTILAALLVGAVGWSYGRNQARLKRDVIQRLHKYQLQMELEKDPTRTSSRLTASGDTRPEDQ